MGETKKEKKGGSRRETMREELKKRIKKRRGRWEEETEARKVLRGT